jgi:hypothetical protein
MKKHNHKLQFLHTSWEYPSGLTGTTTAVEYAYLWCDRCKNVIKKEVVKE